MGRESEDDRRRLEEASGRGNREDDLKKEDALNRAKWRDGVQAIAKGME